MSGHHKPLELHNIQEFVATGYRMDRSRPFLLTVRRPADALRFFAFLVDRQWLRPANCAAPADAAAQGPVSLGFTSQGLRVLGLPQRYRDVLAERAPAFVEGAYARAARRLADTGASAPQFWKSAYQGDTSHVLLTLHADTTAQLDRDTALLMREAGEAFEPGGWTCVREACHLSPPAASGGGRTVHFGFADGISQPLIQGLPPRSREGRPQRPAHAPRPHRPGELLLGYPNDAGFNRWLLATERADLSEPPPLVGEAFRLPTATRAADFFRNGSFGAFREIAQDEDAFQGFVKSNAAELGVEEEYVRAKMLGRWRNGRVVRPGEMRPPADAPQTAGKPGATHPDAFDFSDDQDGLGCPFGAHIRRMNPRADPVVPFRRRVLIRRGIPYGPAFSQDAKAERGLLGIFLCASLEDQFEHLLSEWADDNPMGTANRGNAKDPLIGNHSDVRAVLDIPSDREQSRRIAGFLPFVRTLGTVYLFYPGFNALRTMCHRAAVKP